MKHTQSEITAIKKLRKCKLHPRDVQKKNKEAFDKVKDSIQAMPIWPNKEAIRKFDNVIVVKIGESAGAPLPFQ